MTPSARVIEAVPRFARQFALCVLALLGLGAGSVAFATPTAPGNLTAVTASSTQINLTWTAATDTGGTITAYIIQRCLGSSCSNFAQVGSVASGTTYSDSGLTPASAYNYQIYATDATSSGPFSNAASATTLVTSISSAITYAYDALGRLIQANVSALNLVENYTYDSAGNLTSVTSSPVATLEVANLSSPQGPVGGTVTIYGSGFSTTPASNTVDFNGKPATVTSATSTQLIVTVPTGATTGPITVKTGSTTVSSPGSYTITAKTGAPTISFVPTAAAAGSTITIQGTGFQTTAANNKVQINESWATVVSATSTSLQVIVPNIVQSNPNYGGTNVGVGLISITTPFGSVTSATPLIISYQTYTIVGATTVNGAPLNLSTATTPLYAIVTFSGTQGQTLAIGVSGVSPANAANSISVLAPNGTYLTGLYITGNGGGQIPVLPMSGTYTVLLSGYVNNVALSVVGPTTGILTLNGTPTNVALTLPGQAASFTFSGTANTYATLSLSNVTLPGGYAAVTLLNPDGTTLLASQLTTTSGATFSPLLTQSGTYTLLVVPRGSNTAAFTLALTSAQNATLLANQAPYNLTLTNQTPTTLYFNGSTGQYLSLGVNETSGTISTVQVTVYDSDGVQMTNSGVSVCSTCRGQVLNFGPLATSGVYSVVVQQPYSSVSGTIALALATPVAGTASLGGSSNATVNLLGQGVAQTFQDTAGQYVSAAFTSVWSGTAGTISILGVDDVAIGTQTFYGDCGGYQCNSSAVISVGPLPSTGTYTVLTQQINGGWGASTGQLTLTLEPMVQGTITLGTPTTVPVLTGQGFEETFAATAGQYLSVALQTNSSGATVTSGTISILDPNAALVATAPFTGTCATACSGSGVISVGPLNIGGTYTVLFQQTNSSNPPAAGNITVTPEVTVGGTLTDGSSSNIPVAAGQGFSETLSGTAGQYLSVAIGSQGTAAVTSGTITVLSSSGTVLMSAPYTGACVSGSCSGAGNVNVGPLPATGTYTVVFQQTDGGGGPAAAALTVTPELPVTGALTLGSPTTVNLVNAQGIQQTFSGTAEQYDTVSVSETSSLIKGATFAVLAPSGVVVASGTFTPTCTTTCTGSTTINVGPLPSTGTYTLLVQQAAEAYGFGSGALTVEVTNNAAGSGTTQNINTTVAGQAAQFTFSAAAAQAFDLTFTNMVFTPTSVTSYSVKITAPDGTQAYYNICYSANCEMSLTGITQSGAYTVTVTPGGSATMIGTATLSASAVGTLVLGTAFPLNLAIGQGAALTFSVAQGQSVALQIGSLTSSPANAYYTFSVVNPSGLTTASAYTYVGTTLNLPNLAAGMYTLTITPGNPPASSAMQITLATGVTDPLPLTGAGVNMSTSTPGAAAYVTFAGTYGQSVSLAITNLTLTPNTVTYASVSDPVNSVLDTWYGSCSAPGCEVHMPFIPATASYSSAITPAGAATMSFTATLTPDVTATLSWGTPLNLTLSETGQSAMVTFNVAPGAQQNPSISVSAVTTNPTTAQYYMTVYDVDRGYQSHGGSTYSNGGSAVSNLSGLAPGTYLLMITPSVPAVGSMQITVAQNATKVIPTNGTTTNITTTVPGQYEYMSFSASAGQSLSLALINCTFSPTSTSSLNFLVYDPNGSEIAGAACYANTPGGVLSLPNLTQTGTYTVQVYPGGTATMSFGATLSQDATGTLALNTPKNESLTIPGQNARLTFTATAGETVALTVGSVVTTPSGNGLWVTVYNPAGTSIASLPVSAASPQTFNLNNLTAGTYSVLVTPAYATTQTFTVTLISGDTGVLPANGSSNNFSTTTAGQAVYLTFSATAGQSLSFGLNNLVVTPSGGYASIYIYPPTGTTYLYYLSCVPTSQPFCAQSLPVLPQSGTYTIEVFPTGQNTMSFTAELFQDVTGTLVSTSSSNVSLPSPGENAVLTFTAPGGQTAIINASAIATIPASSSVGFYVYNSAGTLMGSTSGTSTATLSLANLAAGVYSLIIAPSSGATASMQVTGSGIQ